MIVDGYVTDVQLTGDFAAGVQWKQFAIGKLRDILRAGRLTQGVMDLGDVRMRYFINHSSKLARVWVEATVSAHALAFWPTKIKYNAGLFYNVSTDKYGKPYKQESGEPINDPVGTLNGTIPGWLASKTAYVGEDLTKVFSIKKSQKAPALDRYYWGCNDWVHTKETTNGERKLLGYVTFGTIQGRSNSVIRYSWERYDYATIYADYIPTITNAPSWQGGTNAAAVYYNGKRLLTDAPGHVLGAAIVDREVDGVTKRFVIGVSAGATHGVTFGAIFSNPAKSAPKNYVLWKKEVGSTDPTIRVGTVESIGTSKFFDYGPLFAFNASATKCSAVIRTFFPAADPYFTGAETPDVSLGPMVFHVDWTDIDAPTVTNEGAPTPVEHSTLNVSGGNYYNENDQTYPKTGSFTITGSYAFEPQTLAIDYRGDTEVRIEYSGSYAKTDVGETLATVETVTSTRTINTTKTDSFSLNSEWTFESEKTTTEVVTNNQLDGGSETRSDTVHEETKSVHVVYADLRYPIIIWYEIEKTHDYSLSGGPARSTWGHLDGERSYSASSTYILKVLVGTETRTIYTIPWSDSYTQSPYYVLAFGYPVIYGGSVGQYTEVQWSEMYSFELTHNTWIGLNLSNGVYYGQSGDWAPYYSSYEASATVGALVKDDKPFELNAAAYSIAFRPLKCGYRGESLFDRSEEFYRYGSYPDGLRESGKLDLLETPASGELRDFIKSVGIGR